MRGLGCLLVVISCLGVNQAGAQTELSEDGFIQRVHRIAEVYWDQEKACLAREVRHDRLRQFG